MSHTGIDAFLKYQNSDYKLLQLHFHTPAEHRIDDKLYKAEVHLVHQVCQKRPIVVSKETYCSVKRDLL
jgi:carbonic anhydrase